MAAITGHYAPARREYQTWYVDWLHGADRWTSPRFHLATQLRRIRQLDGRHEAKEFRNYLLWLNVYPVRWRRPSGQWSDQCAA
jgi:hypothetical protein